MSTSQESYLLLGIFAFSFLISLSFIETAHQGQPRNFHTVEEQKAYSIRHDIFYVMACLVSVGSVVGLAWLAFSGMLPFMPKS